MKKFTFLLVTSSCFLASLTLSNAALFWDDFSGTPLGPDNFRSHTAGTTFTLNAAKNADNTLTAADAFHTNLTFNGVTVNGTQSAYDITLQQVPSLPAPDHGGLKFVLPQDLNTGDVLRFSFSYSEYMGSANAADPLGTGATQTVNGSTGSMRATAVFEKNWYWDPFFGGGKIGAVDIEFGGIGNVAGALSGGEFIDNFNDPNDDVASTGTTLNFSGAQIYDGRFNGDNGTGGEDTNKPKIAAAAIDHNGDNPNGINAGITDPLNEYGIKDITFVITIDSNNSAPASGDRSFIFTFDGVPIAVPEPTQASLLLLGVGSSFLALQRRKKKRAQK